MMNKESTILKPGSDEAVEEGCECPILDNCHGRGYMGQDEVYVVNAECPMHGRKSYDRTT